MKFKYDFHVHSCLSPCAENDMTPVTIVAFAKLSGLDFIAISDHNAIGSVEVALKAGHEYGITVVPAVEIQTEEDIHILCLFDSFQKLRAFYNEIPFTVLKNVPEIYGDQLIMDEDDNIVGHDDRLLLHGAKITPKKVKALAERYDGVAIPAHVDREGNSMLSILGVIEDEFNMIEISTKASEEYCEEFRKTHTVLVDSDAHTLESIGLVSEIDLPDDSIFSLMNYLRKKNVEKL